MRARIEEARASGEPAALREASARLARWLASRDRNLDEAADLASQALDLGEDVELRREMAAWLESLSEAGRAATALRPIASLPDVDSGEAAYVLVRAGVLKARAGAAAGAVAAFEAAASIDPADALPAELLGAIGAWAPDALPANLAGDAYVEAARRRAVEGQHDAELEDLWRAAGACPASRAAAEALAAALEARGKPLAADEVWRAYARAAAEGRPRHCGPAGQDPARALGAGLDQGLDLRFEGEESDAFDALLLDLGMLEVLAARMALRASRLTGATERARALVELARLYAGPLADPRRAAAASVAAVAADPGSEEMIAALGTHLADAFGVLEGVGDVRLELARRVRHAVSDIADEQERRVRVGAMARASLPPLPDDPRSASEEGRAASAAAWVRATVDADPGAQAVAIERVAASAAPVVRAFLLTAAADRFVRVGRVEDARRVAELATQADPANPRCVAILADAFAGDSTRPAAAALERAIALVGPRATWCVALADALEVLGERELTIAWTQRLVALRPGDRGAIERLVERLLVSGDGRRLGDAMAWLLSQPHAATWLGPLFARGLGQLSRLEFDHAAVVARRALDVFGARLPELRDAMLETAMRAGDDSFTAAILERWLSSGAEGVDRRSLFVRLADVRERLGDVEGQARLIARATEEGLGGPEIAGHLARLTEQTLSGDALVWRLRARASRPYDDVAETVESWRALGVALWDLADDRVGAIGAWQRAAGAAPASGHMILALDLVAVAGREFAFEYMSRLVEAEPDDARAAVIAADAGRAALRVGEAHVAFDLAARGLARKPSHTAALEVAERATDRTREHDVLSGLYELVASRALGRFGRRAAHHRGARLFERRGEHALALKHAAQAFYAVPAEGSSFQLLARAADRAGDRLQAVRTLEQVAEGARDASAKAAWLLRAASIAGGGEEGARRRVDVLLRATFAAPGVATIALLHDAAADLLRSSPEDHEGVELRVAHAARKVTARLEGPDGGRVALAFASITLDLFSDAEVAFDALERAFDCDADIDEYARLVPAAAVLATAPQARERVATMLAAAEKPHANVGTAVLRLLGTLAEALGDVELRARAAVAAASREPDDDALVIEADAAIRGAPELAERLHKRVSRSRLAEALVAAARARLSDGAPVDAAPLFERAVEFLEGSDRAEVDRELRAAWDAAGRGTEIEARVEREAASETVAPALRAERWEELAQRRESRGDRAGANRAQAEACRLDPEPLQRWSALERLAELSEDDDARVLALEHIVERVAEDGRVAVLKRLGRAHERRRDVDAAMQTWQAVLHLDPDDEMADQAIESLIVARGRYDELVDHLARRAERLSVHSGAREVLRAVRLRRAAILEQRLGRLREACDELALLLNEWPRNVGALRYMADLLERQGDHAMAAPLWRKAAANETDLLEKDELELRAGRASMASGDLNAAAEHARRVLARRRDHRGAAALALDAAQAQSPIGASAQPAATGESSEARSRSDAHLEAAQVAAQAGDTVRALDLARRAAETAPERGPPQLFARGLEYRQRGAGSPDEARQTIEDLAHIGEPLARDDVALRAFLLAEARDVVQGGAAGMQELEVARKAVGPHAVLELGLAERLFARGQHDEAVDAYRVALAGPLLDLRRPGEVALVAADAAVRARRLADAERFLDLASQHPGTRDAAEGRRARLAELVVPPQPVAPVSAPAAVAGRGGASGADPDLAALEGTLRGAATPEERARARLALARARLERGDVGGAEPLLWEALADGLAVAGDLLAPVIASAADRTRDLVRIRRQQVVIEPGDVARLESLRAAALADEDRVYARAVEHVLRAFDPGAGPLPPPPLMAQPVEPGTLALLSRPSCDTVGEGLALVWEGAAQLFSRDAASYGITGVERVVPGNSSVIARLYEAAMRTLDAPRIPLFVPRGTSGVPSSHVALLLPPSVILAGEVREETVELRYALGRGMSAALPQNVLRLGLPPAEGRAVLSAVRVAFGPSEVGRRVDVHAARLAESFWQVIPPRVQRRLQELLAGQALPEHEELVARAQQSGRRVGMFLAGDFAHAVRTLFAESPDVGARPSVSMGTLRAVCEENPNVADLLRLAVSPEYAAARWQAVARGPSRGTMSSGRFSLF